MRAWHEDLILVLQLLLIQKVVQECLESKKTTMSTFLSLLPALRFIANSDGNNKQFTNNNS